MKKTILTVFAFLAIFGFTVSGALSQVTWGNPYLVTPPAPPATKYVDIEFYPSYDVLTGQQDDSDDNWSQVMSTAGASSTLTFNETSITGQGLKSVFAPPVGTEYIIDADTVAMVVGGEPVALVPQPFIPTTGGAFTSIAAGPDGKLYVLFDKTQAAQTDPIEQYLLVGESNWEEVTVRFSPRSLNLGSKGKWVTCKISDFPGDYTPAEVDMDRVCIVAVNGKFLAENGDPICSKDSGGPYNNRNKKKLMVKFDRQDLADFITANPITDEPNIAKITVAGYSKDGELQFYGEDDTIKTKPAKPPKKNSK
jgi:hypothetical protein